HVVNRQWRSAVIQMVLPSATGLQTRNGICCRVDVRGEVLQQRGLAVKGNHRDPVGNVPYNRFEHRSQTRNKRAVFVKLTCSRSTNFNNNNKSKRLAPGLLPDSKFLWDTVVT